MAERKVAANSMMFSIGQILYWASLDNDGDDRVPDHQDVCNGNVGFSFIQG